MRRAIYDYFTTQTDSNGDTFNLGTFEEFEKDMNDPKIRKSFYDYMSSQIDDNGDYYNLGTFEEFEKDVAPKKTISAEQQAPQQVAPQSQYIAVSLPKTQPVQGGIPKQEATTTPIIAVDNKTEGMVAENETPTAPQAGTPINPSEGVMETPKEEQLNIAPTPQGVTPVAEETTQESLSEQKEIEVQGNQGPIAEVQEAEETKSTPEGEAKEVTLEDVISSHKTALGEGEAVYNDYVVDNIPEWIDQGMLGNPYIYDYNVQTSNIIFNAVRNKMISEGKTPSQDEVVAKIKGMSSEDIDKALTEKDKSKIVAEKNRYESAFINKGEATSILGKAMENEQLRKYLAMAIGKDENASAEDVAIALSATVRGLDGDLRKALDSKNKEYDVVRKALADYYNVKGIFGNDAYDEFMSSEIGKDTDVMNMGQLWRKMFGYANSPLYPRKYKELVTDAMRQVHATHTSDTKEGKEYLNNAIGRIDSYLDVKNQVSPDKMNELLQTINSRLPGTQRLNSWEDVFFYQHPTTYPIPMELTPQGIALDALNSYLNNTLLKDANEGEIKALEARVNERATENMIKTQHKLDSNPLLLFDENKALQTNRASNWGMDQEYLLLKGALDIRKDAYEYGENAGKDESFVSNLWRGFADKAFDIKNWDLGLSKFGEAANLMLIIDKSEKGEELTYAENAFIDAIATDFAVKSITKASRGYKAGMVTAEALPFMVEMLFSPLKGGGAMANKFARLMLKKYGKDTIKKNAGKYLMGKLGSRLLGDLGKAYGMALTTGAMNVGADAINRNVGKVKYNVAEGGKIVALKDEEGKIVTEDAVGGAEAIFDAINSRAIENFSEFTGGYLPGGVWLKSLANKVGLSKAVKYYDKISSTAWAKNADRFFERTQWHGPIEEFNEEMIGGVLNAIVVGDQTLDTAENTGVFNNDNLIDTALGVGVMSVLMSSVKTMGYRTASQQLEAQKKNTIKLGEDVLGDDWADIQSTIDNATAYNLAKELNALLSNNKYSADGKRIIMRYGMEVAEGDALISAEERQQMAYESETKVDNASRLEGSARLGWNTTDANEQYVANKQYEERGNAVVDMLQYDGESADDALLSRYGVSDSYDIADKVSADADLNTKQKQTILGYLDSREQVVAMGQRALRDTQISAVNAVRNDKSNIQSGKTIVATHKVDGHEMYVIDGNVALNEDGTIDVGNSDDSIIVENKETGEREFISPSMFSAVTEQESANVMSDAVSAKSQSYTNAMTYGHTLEQGEDIVIDGVTHKVENVDYNNNVVSFTDGTTIGLEELAQEANQRNAERTRVEVVEKATPKVAEKPQATPTEVSQVVERTAPQQGYTQGKAIVYKDASGNYRMAEVMQEADPDGNIIIIDTFTGDTHQVSSSQLDQWQAEVATETTQEEVPSSQGILDNSIPVAENAPIAVDVTEEVEAENPTATTETQVEVTPQVAEQPQTPTTQVAIPTDEKGNPLYEQMSVEDTISNLYNDPDLDEDEADAFVQAKINGSAKRIKDIDKKKPKIGEDKNAYVVQRDAWRAERDAEQAKFDYWNAVQSSVPDVRRKERVRMQMDADLRALEAERNKKAEQAKQAEERGRNRADYRKAIAQWKDTPSTFHEYVAQALLVGEHKMRWDDNGSSRGLGSHTTGRRTMNKKGQTTTSRGEEYKSMRWLLDKNGESPEALADRLWNDYTDSYGEDMAEGKPLDVLLDVVTSMPTPQSMWEYVKGEHDIRMEAEQSDYQEIFTEAEIEHMERDAMFRERFGMSEAEYWDNEAIMDEFIESRQMSAEGWEEFDNFVAEQTIEEYERINEENERNEQRRDSGIGEGGSNVLQGEQFDNNRGNERIARETQVSNVSGVDSNATPQAEQKQSIKSETTPGIVRNAYSAYVPKEQVEQLDKVAQALGVQIEFVPTMRGANAKIVGNKVTVALDAEQIQQEGVNGVIMVIGHELTHRIKSLSNEAFEDFASVIESILPEEFKQRMIATRLAYSRQGLKISNEALREEVVADLAGIVMANKDTMEKFLKALEPKSTKQQILDVLKQMFEAIKGVFQGEFAREIAKAEKVLLESMKKASAVVNEGNTIEADNTGQKLSIIGEKGAEALDKAEEANTRMDNLSIARKMERFGYPAKGIRMATGWERGADGEWRYEIEDIKLKDGWKEQLWNDGVALADVVTDKDIFSAYPELKDIAIKYDQNTLAKAYFDPTERLIGVNPYNLGDIHSSILHEVQHVIQTIEGFAKGSNITASEKLMKKNQEKALVWSFQKNIAHAAKDNPGLSPLELIDKVLARRVELTGKNVETLEKEGSIPNEEGRIKAYNLWARGYDSEGYEDAYNKALGNDAYEVYRRHAGEVESRNVQSRMGYTPEQRRATLLEETEDVAREDQIFLLDNSGVSAMGSTVVKRKADIAFNLQGKDVSPTQLKVVDAFTTDVNNIAIDVVDANGKQRNITLKQGQDNRAGVKHSVLKHYETASNSYSAEDILLIPQIIEQGERKQDGKKVSYKLGINGVTYSVTTEINNRGAEVFTNFYTNRSGNARSSNTQLSAQADSTTTSTDKGSDNVGDVQGLEKYSDAEIKDIVRNYIDDIITENGFDAEIVDMAIYGSRNRGTARGDSDLDIVVEYSGAAREDDLFNALNDAETQLEIDGVMVDINPITKGKSGNLSEFMARVREYDNNAKYSLHTNSQEVADIVAKAKADGAYMKAPNGEATNLTEEQWANVRTKAFKEWFGDWENDPENASKIVDENGEPMVVYHGTEGKFNVFDRTKGRASMDIQGMFFSPWELDAQGYGRNVRAFYLNIRKPSSGGLSYKALNRYQGQMYAGVKARDYLIGLGYDGVNNYGEEFIAFNPNQIKSATENVGTYSSESDDVRYSLRDTILFYSNAERAVENIKQGKATPEQWLAMIQKNGGLKAGEDKWLGLSDWLKDSKAKSLTKDEVLEFIKANQIVVEEVNYGGASIVSVQSEFDKLTEEHGNYEGAFEEMVNRYGDDFSMAVWYDEYGQLHLEEGYEDYGEILGMERGINPTRLEYTTQGLENNKEIALVVPSIEPYNQYDEIHFGDAGDGRAVAWVRFGETRVPRQVEVVRRAEGFDTPYKNANGGDVFKVKGRKNDIIVYTPLRDGRKKYIPYVNEKFIGTTEETAFFDTFEEAQEAMNRYYVEHPVYKTVYDNVLVIDEIQSKRHQDGREKGYQGKDIAQRKARIDEIRERLRVISERRSEISDLIPTDIRGILNRANYRKTMPENEEFERLRDEDIALRRELDEITLSISERNAVPDAPFDKNWQELAMKRMLRYAAENGFDKVAWTTGEQQAERYSMVRLFNDIEREDNPNLEGRRFVLSGANAETFQVDDNGNITASTISEAEGKSLQEVVGKEMAIKMMNLEDGDLIENEDLRIGGEGMKGFYDKMLPSFMNKYGKKWGVKVGETTMPNIGDNGLTMHSIDVTDEMKKSVMEGQPLFSLRGTTDVQLKEDVMGEMMERNPKGWESIKDKLRGTTVWNEVVNDEEFADVRDDEDVITGEVLSRLKVNIDDLTEQMVNNAKGIFEKADAVAMADRMRRALKEFDSWVEKEGIEIADEEQFAETTEGEDVRYSLRTKADPQNTIEVYKLFNVDKNGMPQALFIDADNKLELGVWYDADSPKVKDLENLEPGKAYLINEDGDVVEEKEFKINVAKGGKKSISSLPSKEQVIQATKDGYRWMTVRLGADGERQYHTLGINGAGGVTDYALRPGWHATDSPSARHIGEGKSGANAIYRKPNQRWFKVEISADHDYNEEAREGYLKAHPKAKRKDVYKNLKGDITDKIPEDGFYNFKTNSNANPNQSWFIAGAMKIVEPLTEEEAHEISRANGVEIDLPYKDGVKTFEDVKYSLRGNVEAINNKFNEELQQQINGTLPEGHIYQLGLPSEILLNSGFPNMPIELSASNLLKHATMERHSFDLKDVRNLVNSIQRPIAIFAYGDKEKSQNLIVELQKDGKNFLVGIHFNQQYRGLEVSDIRGIFPRDNSDWLNWIQEGKALYIDKERVLNLINQQRRTLAEVAHLDLNSITKLVNDFDKTNISAENNQKTLKYSLRGVLHPKGDGDYDGTRAEYNRRVGVQKGMRKLGYKFREGHQDSMLSLKILQEIVAKANGKDPKNLPSWQDAYIQENLMSSRNKAEKDIYMRDFFKPLMEEVEKLLKKGMGYEEITQYMIAKHGLERNALMAERVAKEEADKVLTERDNLAKRVARVKANKALEGVAFADWTAKKEAWKQEYESAYNAEKLAEDEAQDLWMKEYKKAIKEAKGRDFSGLTALFDVEGVKEAEIMAQALIDEVERDYNMDSLWNKVRKATQESLATQYKAGLISRQTYDKVRDMYQYYIPLKGFKEMTADEEYEYLVANAPLLPSLDKRAMGRSSVADDPLATIAMDADAAIIKANRNKMKQAFYHFVKNNPSSLVSINEQWYIKDPVSGKWVVSMPLISADATDEEIQQAIEEHEERMKELAETGDATTKTKDLELDYIALPQHQIEHAVRVKINGKEYVMYINGNPRAAQALNGLTNPEAFNDAVTKFGKKVNNFMAQMFTSGNPAFIFTNGMRDIQWATNAVMIKENVAYQMEYAKCLAKAMQIPRLIIKEGSGSLNMDKETQKYFDEFIRYGGETGYTAIQQIDDYKKKVDQLVNGVKWYDTPLEGAKKVIEGVEYLNRSVEDVTRFAVYMASRKMGRTPERSAYDAKEITVNFNKKGSGIMGARYMGAFYLFYNASVQSLNGLAKLYKQNPIKASARTAMWAGVSAMLPIMNELLIEAWGDDDDKEAYDNLPEWVRKNNLVFYIPGTDAKFFTISLPHEMRPWTTIGYVANEVFSGKMEAGEAFKHITLGFADMLPMDFAGNGGNIVVNLTPTWAQPMTQILFNVDYFGKPVYKNSDYSKNKPEFTTAFKGTSPILVDLSRAVNAIGGGDESKKGSVDVINPDVVQHLVESYFGGVGKTINKSLNTIAMLGDEDMREVKNIPIVSSFMIGNEERTSTGYKANQRYYEIKDEVSKYDDALSIRKDIIMQGVRANATQEEKDKANEYFEKLVEDADSKNTKQYLFAKGYIDYIDKLRRGLDDIDQSRREEVEKNISDAMIELNKGYNKADEKSIEELKKQKEDLSQKARDLIEGWNGKNFIDDTYQNNKWAKKDLNEAVREFNPNALREWKNKHNIVKDK